MNSHVLTVTQLNTYVRSLMEGDPVLSGLLVTGEISNFKEHYQSGHLYFSLKDAGGLIRSVMFRSGAARLKFRPENGMQVICRGRVSLYEKDGQYQFYAEDMQPDGIGSLTIAFEQIKERLAAEGLFDQRYKRPIPQYPGRAAVITSETGAAIRDILSVLGRRFPACDVILCPVLVQGDAAVGSMIDALERVNRLGCADVIIIGRGGGSIEDLWAFNSEELARAVRNSGIPVISAVGHETDFTICDFAADLRAPTPSAAAELAVPDGAELLLRIQSMKSTMRSAVLHRLSDQGRRLALLAGHPALKSPGYLVDQLEQRLDAGREALRKSYSAVIGEQEAKLKEQTAALNALNPFSVLARGYSVAYRQHHVANSVADFAEGDSISLRMRDGTLECRVVSIQKDIADL